MKTFKAIGAAFVLAVSLSITAYADTAPGDGHCPGAPIPTGTPTTDPKIIDSTGETSTIDGNMSFMTVADILLAFGFDLIR